MPNMFANFMGPAFGAAALGSNLAQASMNARPLAGEPTDEDFVYSSLAEGKPVTELPNKVHGLLPSLAQRIGLVPKTTQATPAQLGKEKLFGEQFGHEKMINQLNAIKSVGEIANQVGPQGASTLFQGLMSSNPDLMKRLNITPEDIKKFQTPNQMEAMHNLNDLTLKMYDAVLKGSQEEVRRLREDRLEGHEEEKMRLEWAKLGIEKASKRDPENDRLWSAMDRTIVDQSKAAAFAGDQATITHFQEARNLLLELRNGGMDPQAAFHMAKVKYPAVFSTGDQIALPESGGESDWGLLMGAGKDALKSLFTSPRAAASANNRGESSDFGGFGWPSAKPSPNAWMGVGTTAVNPALFPNAPKGVVVPSFK